jgi:hypothetical protein
VAAQPDSGRRISGVVVGPKGEVLNGATIVIRGGSNEASTFSDGLGQFSMVAPLTEVTLHIEGQYIKPKDRILKEGEPSSNLRIEIEYLIPPIHQSLVITMEVYGGITSASRSMIGWISLNPAMKLRPGCSRSLPWRTVSNILPMTISFNYGRGINTRPV